MKKIIIIPIILAILVSCSDLILTPEVHVEGSDLKTAYVENSVLHLPENFLPLVDSILSLPIIERKGWENDLGFKSYNTACDNVYDKLDRAESWEEYVKIVNLNSKFLHFTQDSSVDHTIDYEFYRAIANEEKQFAIGKTIYSIEHDGIYEAEGAKLKVSSFNHEHVHASNLKCGRITNLNGVTPTGNYFCCYNCENGMPNGQDYEIVKAEGNRRVRFSYKIYRINLPAGPHVNSYRIDVKLRGEKKNWLGNWKSDNTRLHYRNLTGSCLSFDVRGVSEQLPNGLPWYSIETFDYGSASTSEVSTCTWTFPVYVDEPRFNATLYTGAQLTEPWFDSFNIEFSSRGLNNYYSHSRE